MRQPSLWVARAVTGNHSDRRHTRREAASGHGLCDRDGVGRNESQAVVRNSASNAAPTTAARDVLRTDRLSAYVGWNTVSPLMRQSAT